MVLRGLYAIADAGFLAARGITLQAFAAEMREAGVTLLQYRDKDADDEVALFRAGKFDTKFMERFFERQKEG